MGSAEFLSVAGLLVRLTLVCVWLGSACSLAVDTSDLDQGCPESTKPCDRRCVRIDDPFYGCMPTGCKPCALEHAIPRCEDNACGIDSCELGYGRCQPSEQGCQTELFWDPEHCGGCGKPCADGEACIAGSCILVD